ncbi:hypothetical protein BU251_07200 [Candidatus Velamenicoccus archaeovorus]|uniref:Uncharacterized protein n=1 Tax=Velamenicoccus archaeovorus TaxID=1930593 RepID=A0A410P5P9_VELA1|nr:hypothetical protein BU251_07200 [Candidatus Velamenicoccus archaeovorus]
MAVLAGCAQADGLPWRKFSSAQVRSQRLFLNFAYNEVFFPAKLTPSLRKKFHAGLPWREIYERRGEE